MNFKDPPIDPIELRLEQGFDFHNSGLFDQARKIYESILKDDPNHFDALQLLGNLEYQTKNHHKALKLLNDAISIDSSVATVHNNRGNVLKDLNFLQEARLSYEKAIQLRSDYPQAYLNYGNLLKELDLKDEALRCYGKAISFKHDYSEAYSNRGVLLAELNQFDKAIESYNYAINCNPNNAEAYSNRANLLVRLNCIEEAFRDYGQAIQINPLYVEAYINQGLAFQSLNYLDKALLTFEKALEIDPNNADAHLNRSLALLSTGNFKEGLPEYEWRWKSKNLIKKGKERIFNQPLWLGEASIANKTILLWSEQGLGDCIQFSRYASLVKKQGAKVLLEVPKQLLTIMQNLEGVDFVFELGEVTQDFDYQCPLMSLPLAFKTDLSSIPHFGRYLKICDKKTEVWLQRIGDKNKPRVGLVWSGNLQHKNDHNRSLALSDLLKFLPPDFEYFSLQKEVRIQDEKILSGSFIKHYENELIDFSDTTALCDLMDLVVSVDTSVAHLSGALNKITWVLLPYAADWRWLLRGETTPWYPSLKLFRQGDDRQYGAVLDRLRKELLEILL